MLLEKRGEKLLTGFIGTTRDIAESYLYFAKAKYVTGDREYLIFSKVLIRN